MDRFVVVTDPRSGQKRVCVPYRGAELKSHPLYNKGTCFSAAEREELGLHGVLPPHVSTPEEQEARAYANFQSQPDALAKYVFMTALHDRNETLFYKLVTGHFDEMAPIVYTPTVGQACAQYSHIYRRSRGLYITPDDRGRVEQILRNAPFEDVRLIVVTDSEAILGLGDLGVGGMGIPIGKLVLYTAGGGIHPTHCLPVDLDVGTENTRLLSDPLYLGVRRRRLRGAAYDELVDEFVAGVQAVFPRALIQWEDFATANAFAVLERHRQRVLSFNDDIQGTGAVVLAGVTRALRITGRTLRDARIVIVGLGAAGGGCARQLRAAMRAAGVPDSKMGAHLLTVGRRGLIMSDEPNLRSYQAPFAADPALVAGWERERPDGIGLFDVVRNFRPDVLVGTSASPGLFTREIVEAMAAGCPRPMILPLSNPTDRAEATPAELIAWTNGAALVATGSPFASVEWQGVRYTIAQGNNALAFPGIGLGAIAVRARELPDAAFLAAARAIQDQMPASAADGDPIFPPMQRLREVSRAVAGAAARAIVESGAHRLSDVSDLDSAIDTLRWTPSYLPYVFAPRSSGVSRRRGRS